MYSLEVGESFGTVLPFLRFGHFLFGIVLEDERAGDYVGKGLAEKGFVYAETKTCDRDLLPTARSALGMFSICWLNDAGQ